MRKFELSAYGVEEMESQEMKNVDGGLGWMVFAVANLLCEAYTGKTFVGWAAVGVGEAAEYIHNAYINGVYEGMPNGANRR